VKGTLEHCLTTYFKTPLRVSIDVLEDGATVPAEAPAPAPTPEPAAALVTPDEPQRDIVGERMKKLFGGSEEITE
jgi:hypothetical protein